MENNTTSVSSIKNLVDLLKSNFPVKKVEVGLDDTHFAIYFNETVTDKPPLVKTIHDYLKAYIIEHGDPKDEYQFSFHRDHELIDIVHFNSPDAAHYIDIELSGKMQTLRIQDVLGMTGDYTIFNEDFEKIGQLSAVSNPVEVDEALASDEELDFYSDQVYADFSNEALWQILPEELKPHLSEILGKVLEDINNKAETFEVDVDDPNDVAFWAEQFEISVADLQKAILVAGKSIDDITAYLQQ